MAALLLALIAICPNHAAAKDAKAAIAPRAGGYDGQWVIDATTSSFFCPVKRKQLVATVQGGRVVRLTGLPGSVDGTVDHDGGVTINIRVYGVNALVRGRIGGAGGAGDWSANSMICSKGQWSASSR